MENKRVSLFNKKKKDTLYDEILASHGKRNSISRRSIDSRSSLKHKSSRNEIEVTDSSKDFSSSISKVSGFDSVIMRKRNYFRKIKRNNQKKSLEYLHKQRFEIVTKFIMYVFSNVINIISIIIYVLQTYFDKNVDTVSKEINRVLLVVELSTSFYFFFEYILLLTRVRGSFWKYIFSFESLIDLVTTVPSIISYFFLDNSNIRLNFLRIFRIFRVFRILRIYKSLKMIQNDVGHDSEGLLVDVKETTNPISLQIFTIFVILFCNFFICSGLVLGLQDLIDNAFNKNNITFFEALYFIIVTCSTVGYGDIIPTHPVTRIFVVGVLFSIVLIVSHQVTKLINLFKVWGPGLFTYSGSGHIIMICDNSISIFNFLSEIKKKSVNQEAIIISCDIKELPSSEYPYNKVHLITTTSIDLEVLERANTKEADCIFIFSSKDVVNCNQKEKVLDFLILKINRYYSNVTIYVQTLFSERTYNNNNNAGDDVRGLMRLNSFIGGSQGQGNKNILKYKRIFPILRLKSLILSKALFNPGFPTFTQNLLFNDSPSPIDLDPYDPLMQSYFLGCENKIHIRPFPYFFYNKDFFESVLLVYSKSVTNYFRKVATSDDREDNRPVLLIGVVDKRKFSAMKEEIRIFPRKFYIKPQTLGIFISYNGNDYLDNFLKKFNHLDIEALNKENEQDIVNEENKNFDLNQIRRRRSGIFEGAATLRPLGRESNEVPTKNKTSENFNRFKCKSKSQIHPASRNNILINEELANKDQIDENCNKSDKKETESNRSSENSNSENSSSIVNSSCREKQESPKQDNIISQLNNLLCNQNNNNKIYSYPQTTKNASVKFNLNQFNSVETTDLTKERPSNLMPRKSNFVISPSTQVKGEDNDSNSHINDFPIFHNISSNNSDANNSPLNNQEVNGVGVVGNFFSKYLQRNKSENSEEGGKSKSNNSNSIQSNKQSEESISISISKRKNSESRDSSSVEDNRRIFRPRKSKMMNEGEDEFEQAKHEAFLKRKNLILRGNTIFSNENTKNNILFLHALEDKNVDILNSKIEKETNKRYGKLETFQDEGDHEYYIENRIYDVEKHNVSDIMSGHILLIGYQDNLNKLIKLIMYHHKDREVCIMTSNEFDELTVIKLLRQFKTLYYFKGDAQNPFDLLNAGVHKAYSVIFLIETIFKKTNEDMNKILSFKSIDYFFNTGMILELWDTKSTRLIGYQPLNKDATVVTNEFLHPQFLAGRLIYMSLLDKISAISHTQEYVADTWIELLSLGFKSTSTSAGFKTFAGNKSREGFPVLISIEIPESYIGKEYYNLMTDLLCMDEPVMPFGLYIENPLNYSSERNEGKVSRYTRVNTANLKIVTSYKRKLMNISSVDKIEQGYMDNLKILRDISYNDKVNLDYIDVRKPHLPIFITNPPPGFIIHDRCKIMLMHYHQPNVGLKDFQKNFLLNKANKRRSVQTLTDTISLKKQALNNSQENFFFYINKLKESLKKTYTNAFRFLEKTKVEMVE